jgi:hypothetical protein
MPPLAAPGASVDAPQLFAPRQLIVGKRSTIRKGGIQSICGALFTHFAASVQRDASRTSRIYVVVRIKGPQPSASGIRRSAGGDAAASLVMSFPFLPPEKWN